MERECPAWTVRPYDPRTDLAGAHSLWTSALGGAWPISLDLFGAILAEHDLAGAPDGHFVAVANGSVVGFASTQSCGLTLLMVSPAMRRQGIDSALHSVALESLAERGAKTAHLGSGGPARFWPGVPTNLAGAKDFLSRRGWTFTGTSWDLAMPLSDYAVSARGEDVAAMPGAIRVATPGDVEAVLDFELREFAGWHPYFVKSAEAGHYFNILAAWDSDGSVVGSLLLSSPDAYYSAHQVSWQGLLGERMGAIGSVGVSLAFRGRGIGVALVTEGTRLLRSRGAERGFIGWTTIADWYGKVGYQPWRSYDMGQRECTQK